MLYLITALYEEASPFIQALSLKKDLSFPHFELFYNETVWLLITKPGAVTAAAALSSLLTMHPAGAGDFLLSIGSAACADVSIPAGTPFLIQSIKNESNGRTWYPELLYRAPFSEAALVTAPAVLTAPPKQDLLGAVPLLYDMEGSAVYETAKIYLSCHQIALVKVVSDHMGEIAQLSYPNLRALITTCIQTNAAPVLEWVFRIERHLTAAPLLDSAEEDFLLTAKNALRLSATSTGMLRQLMLYLHLARPDYLAEMKQLLCEVLPSGCHTKKEGKDYLEQLRQYFL